MTPHDAQVTWVDAREELPRSGEPVAVAVTGRYPQDPTRPETASGEDFWLVRSMYFTSLHFSEDGAEHTDCFIDSDGYIHLPYGRSHRDAVTHWAALPALPGTTTHMLLGDEAQPALRKAWGDRPAP